MANTKTHPVNAGSLQLEHDSEYSVWFTFSKAWSKNRSQSYLYCYVGQAQRLNLELKLFLRHHCMQL